MPTLDGLTFHKMMYNKIAANLIYWTKDTETKKLNGMFMITFVMENNRWKFFTTNSIETPEYANMINAGDYKFLEEEGFQLMTEILKVDESN